MVKNIKFIFFMVFLLIFTTFVSADINMYVSSREVYNLNDDVEISVSIKVAENLRGFLRSNVECDNYGADYYITPIKLEGGQIETLEIPPLNLFSNMLGTCRIKVSLLDNNLNLVEEKSFNEFSVSDELSLNIELNKGEFLSGDELVVSGKATNLIGQSIEDYIITFYMDNNKLEDVAYFSSDFSYKIRLDEKIKSNNHELKFEIEDDYGNKGQAVMDFFVKAVPTSLKNNINKLEFLPGEEVSIGTLLYDQAGDSVYSDVNIKVYDSEHKLIVDKTTDTDNKVSFNLDEHAVSGAYEIITKNEYFEIEGKFYVKEVKDVDIYFNNGKIFVENKGNVKFKDEVFVDIGEFSFFEDVDLDVGEKKEIRLINRFEEEGEYELNIFSNGKNFDLGKINLVDDRTPAEKMGNAITGNVTRGFDFMVSTGVIYIIILLVVLLVLWYYLTFKKRKDKIRKHGIKEGRRARERIRSEKERFG